MISGMGGNNPILLSHLKLERGRDEICWLASCCVRRPEFDGAQQGWESTLLQHLRVREKMFAGGKH